MTVKEKFATAIASISLRMAKTSCGAASQFGVYQTKEPESLKKMMNKK